MLCRVTREEAADELRLVERAELYMSAIADEMRASLDINRHTEIFEPSNFDYHTNDMVIVRDAVDAALDLLNGVDAVSFS